jgi:hypothetical protein
MCQRSLYPYSPLGRVVRLAQTSDVRPNHLAAPLATARQKQQVPVSKNSCRSASTQPGRRTWEFHGGNGSCSICPVDFFCARAAPEQCTANSSTLGRPGSMNRSSCLCAVGFYREADKCRECEPGSFCFDEQLLVCPANSSASRGSASVSACVCDSGLRMEVGECVPCFAQQLCREGVVTPCAPGASVVNLFCVCSAGTF